MDADSTEKDEDPFIQSCKSVTDRTKGFGWASIRVIRTE
jgi:hypothetical protein